ncbi:MAG: hypothetical protein PHQ80_01400 [Candidatus ainarchaeum sp.]|nr:hypothetical protein [Candidatus ainarchaeum sp.]MDD5095908.1 hypothetical protein [Candidatus ainarchaeum sp.]
MAPIEKAVAGVGLASSALGIGMTLFFYLMAAAFVEQAYSTSIAQLDNTIGILESTDGILASAEGSVMAISASVLNASAGLESAAEAMGGMGDAVEGVAEGLAAIPMMPSGAVAPLYGSVGSLHETQEYLAESAAGLGAGSGEMDSAALGLGGVRERIQNSVSDLEQTKENVGTIRLAAQGALFFGCLLISLVFFTNGLSFYLQLKK